MVEVREPAVHNSAVSWGGLRGAGRRRGRLLRLVHDDRDVSHGHAMSGIGDRIVVGIRSRRRDRQRSRDRGARVQLDRIGASRVDFD